MAEQKDNGAPDITVAELKDQTIRDLLQTRREMLAEFETRYIKGMSRANRRKISRAEQEIWRHWFEAGFNGCSNLMLEMMYPEAEAPATPPAPIDPISTTPDANV